MVSPRMGQGILPQGTVTPQRTVVAPQAPAGGIAPGNYQGKQQFLADALKRAQAAQVQGPQDLGAQLGNAINVVGTSYLTGKNERAGQAQRDAANQGAKAALAAALRGEPLDAGAIDAIGSEWVDPGYQQVIGSLLANQMKPGAEPDLVQAVGPDGKMTWVPKSQAAGMGSALPPEAKPPATRQIHRNGMLVDQQFDAATGDFIDVGSGPQFAPQQPQQPTATSLLTLVGPDGKTISVDSRDPKVQGLLDAGYVQRESSMFPAPPTGYALTPTGLTPIPGGPADPANKPVTEDQGKARQLYERLVPQLQIVNKTFDALTDPKAQALSVLPGSTYFQSPEYQQGVNALTDIAASYLYSVSGATANPGEVANLVKTITPAFGEHGPSLADKRARINQMVESVKTRANLPGEAPLATSPGAAQPDAGTSVDYSKMSDQELLEYIQAHPNG